MPDPANWQRVYNLTDHGGNVRVELKSPALNNTTDGCTPYSYAMYYLYGMQKTLDIRYWYPSDVSPAHQYNGNEREKVSTGYHDFNFRWFDQQLGRFLEQDPLAEKDYSVSPYAFCGGDPVNRVDPLGLAYFKNGDNIFWDDSTDKQLKRNGYYYDNIGDSFTQYQRNGNQLMKYIWYQNKLQSSEVVSLASGGSDNAAGSSLPVFNNDYTPGNYSGEWSIVFGTFALFSFHI